jgi:hypothetical protein
MIVCGENDRVQIRKDVPSDQVVMDRPRRSTWMLDMRVGLTIVKIRSPRSIDGGAFSGVTRRQQRSAVRRKRTDSVREIERGFLRG